MSDRRSNDKNIEKHDLSPKELRHKRRVRNQVIAYVSLVILICGVGAGAVYGIKVLGKKLYESKVASAEQEANKDDYVPVISAPDPSEETDAVGEADNGEDSAQQVEEVEVETPEQLLEEVVQSCIGEMSLEDKVAGLFIITPEQLTGVDNAIKAGDGTKEALEQYAVGGIVYSSKNIQSSDQIKEMLANTVSYSKYPIFLAVEEEPGKDSTIGKALKLDATDTAAAIGSAGDANAAYEAYSGIAGRLATYGFNLDLAPVADVLSNPENESIGDRAFGVESSVVSDMVSRAVAGLKDNGITVCLKHFPGQGGADGDTHKGLASVSASADDIKLNDIPPFLSGVEAGADMIMVGHFMAPSITGDSTVPCSMSKAVMTELLRGEYGYNGVIITDALNVTSVSEYYAADEAAIKCLKAGADMLLMPEDFKTAYEGVIAAVKDGTIDEQRINDSLARVYRIKYRSTVEN